MFRRTLTLVLVAAATVPAAVLAQNQQAPKPSFDAKWLSWDAGSKTATFALIAGAEGAGNPFNFNRGVAGSLTWTVPLNSTVVMNFVNDDGTPHSAEVISGEGPIPNMSTAPNSAIQRAYTRQALEGMNQGQTDVMRFTATPAGSYRIFCGVPGHGLSGMWIWFKVDSAATAASQAITAK